MAIPIAVAELDYPFRHDTKDVPSYSARQGPFVSQLEKDQYDAHLDYQRHRLSGFTLRHLRDMGVFGPKYKDDVLEPNLFSVQLHPIYKRESWLAGIGDIGFGFEGKWDIWDNDKVHDAFMPVLALASCLMFTAIRWPWYVAEF